MSTRRLDGLGMGAAMLCAALITLTGCVEYAEPGYDDGGVYVEPAPVQVDVFAGPYVPARDVHAYSHRGYESRSEAHHRGGFHGGSHGGFHGSEHRR
ncbi:MAG: hypothetical protein ACREE6_12110 [Limisphaerales bacterium]